MKNLKKTLSFLLAVVMVLGCTVIAGAAETNCPSAKYTDVPAEGNWAHAGIDFMIENGYMNGTGETTFGPKQTTSRAMIVTILYRMASSPEVAGAMNFADVKSGKWYYDSVLWATQIGVTSGVSDTAFAPNDDVTREQIAAFLYRHAGQPKNVDTAVLDGYPDAKRVGPYARTAMSWTIENGIITGKEIDKVANICPKDKATRAEVAAMIFRYVQSVKPEPTVTVGDTAYDTLEKALTAAVDGDTVTVLAPVTLTADTAVAHSITLVGAEQITFTGKLVLTPGVILTADASLAQAVIAGEEGYEVKETGTYNYTLVEPEKPASPIWLSTWGTAEEKCDVNSDRMPQMALKGTTVRQIIRVTTTGSQLRLKFSNQYGRSDVNVESLHIAKQVQADKSTIDTATDTVVTVGGSERFVIKAGETVVTDPVEFEVKALENIAVSMYFGDAPTSNITGHRGARATTYQISGNAVSTETFAAGQTKTTTSWFFLCDVSMYMPEGGRAVVCFGDSITDGYGTDADYLGRKPDSYTRWGDYFAVRLQGDEKTQNVSVINEGIGSNGMLDAYPTDAGKDRYARDLLEHDGVAYVIIHFGVNDMNNLSNTSKYDRMITEYKKMIELAHENDILVYVAPILPFKGNSYYSAASEQLRTMINDWFRSAEADVDGIIDFESAVVDPSDPTKLQEKYTHSDGLHPYDGYSAMADAIDLSLFYTAGWASCEHTYVSKVTAPTCTAGGYTTSTCAKCGKTTTTDKTDPLGHNWDEGTVTKAPTLEERGEVTYTCTRCGEKKIKVLHRLDETTPEDIDFTSADSAEQFQIVNQTSSAIQEGKGLYMITTMDGFEPANDRLSGTAATTPKDLVLVPVFGDWTATLKFDFSQGSAANGYYQFFGFYAMGETGDGSADYNNCAGIRCGNNDMQDFLRENGTITAETDKKQTPGLGSAGTYWLRIVREGDTYTCFRSTDGENFTELFSYKTDVDASYLAIDAYTGMTAGYEFYLKSLTFE